MASIELQCPDHALQGSAETLLVAVAMGLGGRHLVFENYFLSLGQLARHKVKRYWDLSGRVRDGLNGGLEYHFPMVLQ